MSGYRVTSLGTHQGPMSIEEIVQEAESQLTDYNPIIPLRFWLRTADAVQKQAKAYEKDGNEEEAYKFYYRHAILVMRKLASHPELRQQPASPALLTAWRKAKDDVNSNLVHLELLKPRIKKRYDAYLDLMSRAKEDRDRWAQEERNNAYNILVGGQRVSTGGTKSRFSAATGSEKSIDGRYTSGGIYSRMREVDPDESEDLAIQLAHSEFRNGNQARGSRETTTMSRRSNDTKVPRTASGTFFADDSDDDLSSQIRAVGNRRDEAFAKPQELQDETISRPKSESKAPHYPTVPKHSAFSSTDSNTTGWYGSLQTPNLSRLSDSTSSPPARPPKEHQRSPSDPSLPPPIPLKQSLDPGLVEAPDTLASTFQQPGVEEPGNGLLDARKFTFKPTAFTESGTPLRTVFMNSKLRSRFLTIALANTSRGLETCGILCGRLLSNAFFVFTLVIPEQESTSDTCETVNEGALFDYCDKEDLITLGWIHTHPTQTCFMSSRDLHTHGGYQVQLAESVAIVCAPRHEPSWGVFRLTDPPGLRAILNCRQTGLFHPHAEKNVYTDAMQPGHVREVENLPFDVVDLRPDSSWI